MTVSVPKVINAPARTYVPTATTACAVLLAWPLELVNLGGGVIIATCDLLAIVLLANIFRIRIDAIQLFLLLAMAISLLGIATDFVLTEDRDLRPLASMAYFFKPCAGLFVGMLLVARAPQSALDDFMRVFAAASSSFLIVNAAVIYLNVHTFREGYDIFGVSVFGVAGINGFAVYIVICLGLILASVVRVRFRLPQFWLVSGGLIAGLLILAIALSRQAIVGLAAILLLVMLRRLIRRPGLTMLAMALAVAAGIALVNYSVIDLSIWEGRLFWTFEAIRTGDLDLLSNGRVSIASEMLRHLFANPVFGTAFSGWAAHTDSAAADIFRGYNLSPHNQWLGAVWKMGLFAFVPYAMAISAAFFAAMSAKSEKTALDFAKATLIVSLIIFGNTQDVLLYPSSGYLVFLVLGLMSATAVRSMPSARTAQDPEIHRSSLAVPTGSR